MSKKKTLRNKNIYAYLQKHGITATVIKYGLSQSRIYAIRNEFESQPPSLMSRLFILSLLSSTIVGGHLLSARPAMADIFINPLISSNFQVQAVATDSSQVVRHDVGAGQAVATSSTGIEDLIRATFGEQADNAIAIAKCESGLKPTQVGDTHIMGTLDGELIGDSVGLFQIRTGDAGVYDSKPWNRAKANGMSVQEFRVKLTNPEYNVKYAKEMFDRQGWGQWFNCMKKLGI